MKQSKVYQSKNDEQLMHVLFLAKQGLFLGQAHLRVDGSISKPKGHLKQTKSFASQKSGFGQETHSPKALVKTPAGQTQEAVVLFQALPSVHTEQSSVFSSNLVSQLMHVLFPAKQGFSLGQAHLRVEGSISKPKGHLKQTKSFASQQFGF